MHNENSAEGLPQILSDPFADESEWLIAANSAALQKDASMIATNRSFVLSAAFLSLSNSSFAMFAFDWGREILELICGRDVNFALEFMFAASLNVGLILPLSFGLFYGYLSEKNQSPLQVLVLTACVLAGLAIPAYLGYGLVTFAPMIVLGLIGAQFSFQAGRLIKLETSKKLPVAKLFSPALIYLIPAACLFLFHADDGNFGFKEEAVLFSSLLFLSSYVAAVRCRVQTWSAALSCTVLNSLPVTLINVVSICATLALAIIDPLHFGQAMLSTMLIASTTTLAALAGALAGRVTVAKRLPDIKRLANR